MSIETIMKLDDLSEGFKNEVRAFVSFCARLDNLAQQETDAILSQKRLDKMTISREKVEMLEAFEHNAWHIFERVKTEAPHNLALQNGLLAAINDVQGTLKINAGLHLHIICNNPLFSEVQSAATCH